MFLHLQKYDKLYPAVAAVQSATMKVSKLDPLFGGNLLTMLIKFLPHFTVLVTGLILAWYFDTFTFGPFSYTSKKKQTAVDELLRKKHQVVGNECIPQTDTCFYIVDSYYLERNRLTTKRDLLLGKNTEFSLTGVEVESNKPVSWENIDSRYWPVNKLVINARYARLLVASGFIMDSLTFDENDHHEVLIAGLGGGVMSNFFSEISYLNIETTVVEKEELIIDLAERYFDHFETDHLRIVHQDFIEYIKKNDKKFDVIIVDACENEMADVMCPVSAILQKENISVLKKRLTREGTLAVNIYTTTDSSTHETKILDLFSEQFQSCFYLEYFKNKKFFAALDQLVGDRGNGDNRQILHRLRLLHVAIRIRLLETQVDMINQHNQPAQLINVQRPHQIQPPGPLRLVQAQVPQGQPVQIRIQGDPINIGQAQLMNMQGQRQMIPQAPMDQQMQQQQQQQPGRMMNMGSQIRPQMQQQQQVHHGPNPQQSSQIRGMVGGPHQVQQQNQMRMPQNQQMLNPMPQSQQRMHQQPNMQQQNQQMRIQQGQSSQQPQMRMPIPQQQQQQQQQQHQHMQQQGQQQLNPQQQQQQIPQRQMMGNGPQEQMPMQQPLMRDPHQQMQPGQSKMGNLPPPQNRMQHSMQHEQQNMQQGGPPHMNGPSPQPPQMQQGHQNMNGPGPMPQQMRVQQQMQQGPPNPQGMHSNQQMQPHQSPVIRGQMQNSPQQPMRMPPHQQQQQQQQQFQPSPQQGRQLPPGRNTPQMQRQPPIPMNRNMQQGPPPQQNMASEQQQQSQQSQQSQQQTTTLQLPQQAVIMNQQDGGAQMIRINGDHAIINGMEFRLMQVQPGSEQSSHIQLVSANPEQNAGVAQSIQLQKVELLSGMQKVTLQHRPQGHQMIPPNQQNPPMVQMSQNQHMGPQHQQQKSTMQQNQQQSAPMQNQPQSGMQNAQPRQLPQQQQQPPPPPVIPQRQKPPPKPRNRSKKNIAEQQQQQQQQQQLNQMNQQMQQSAPNGQPNGPMQNRGNDPRMMSGAPNMQGLQVPPPKGRGRPMGPPMTTGRPNYPNGMSNDRNMMSSSQGQMMQQGRNMVQVGGMPPDMQRGLQNRNMPRNQQQMKLGMMSNQRPNGKMPIGRIPSTNFPQGSQLSTSQTSQLRPPADPATMTKIKDAICSHVSGTKKMTPEYIKYVTDELTRILRELEKVGLASDFRYISTMKLLALVRGEDPSKIKLPEEPERPERPPLDDQQKLPDEPRHESIQSRKRRYDGYLKLMSDAYPMQVCNTVFPRIDDDTIRKEAANYMRQDMKNRAAYLKENINEIPENLRTKAKIEYLGLNLIELQEKVRKDVEATLVYEPPTEFLINPWSIRRTKAEYALELKQHPDRAALEKKRRVTNNLLLHNLSKHTREFRDFHKTLLAKHTKVRKAMQTHITNEAKRKTREELKNEKLRIQKLIQEDEEGYRAMLDDKKDQRLVYLLEQTDGYIESLCELLKKQQNTGDGVAMRTVRKKFVGKTDENKVKSILDKARNDDDEYEDKTKSNFEDYYTTAHGIREEIKEQHFMMGGGNPNLKLKPYQLKGLEWMVSLFNNNLNGILADEMGLGKTIQTIAFITYLMEVKKTSGPFLVIVPLSTVSNWKNEFDKWAANVHLIVYKGPKDGRKAIEPVIKSGKFNVLLTTFEYVIREKALLGKLRWKYMIIDEGHRLKNQHCKLTEMLNTRFQCQRRLLITGTPLQNKLPELWALLNFLLPAIFSSCSTFEQWFNAPFATTGEKVELTQEETMLIIRRLHKVLRPFLLRRLKKEVESELPDKMEFVIKCEMSALQKVLYKHMQKGLLLDGKQNSGSRSLMNSMVHLRKLCNHPFLFRNVEDSCRVFWKVNCVTGTDLYRVSGKLELLDRILPKLQATGHRVLMFFQMTSMMTVVEDYLAIKPIHYLRLDGSTKPDERGLLLNKFNAPNSKYFLFMLSTRAGGLGLNLQTADTVIIFDSDWNPHQDMQAQDRAHRIGQKAEVRVLRLITAGSVEEKILASAKFKLNVDEKVIQAGKFDNRSTGAERRQILEAIIKSENDTEEDDEIPTDEDINDMLSRSEKEFELFQKMDQERNEKDKRHKAKPRLIGDDEIPRDILQAADETDFHEKAKEEGRVAYLEVMPGSRRKRKEVDYSADSMSDDKFLEKLLDGEDIAPEKTETRVEPQNVKPSATDNSPLTFKVPRLIIKMGDEKRKRKSESGENEEKSPKKTLKDDEHRSEKKIKRTSDPTVGKIKIKLPGEPNEKYAKIEESPKKKKAVVSEEGPSRSFREDEKTPRKDSRRDSESSSSSEKKRAHKHKKHGDKSSDITPSRYDSPSSSDAGEGSSQPLKLKLSVRFKMPEQVFDIPGRDAKDKEKSEQKKKLRENETEEERKIRKEAKREKKRLLAAQEEEARLQEKLAKKARKEQRRMEKERSEVAGSSSSSSSAATTSKGFPC